MDGSVKRSLAMVIYAFQHAIAKAYGLDAATPAIASSRIQPLSLLAFPRLYATASGKDPALSTNFFVDLLRIRSYTCR